MPPSLSWPETATVLDLARCPACGQGLHGRRDCSECASPVVVEDGILEAIGELSGNNAVAAAFYDGPGWTRFRPWEHRFLRLVGGREKARREILRHLPDRAGAKILEVGIGDGENLDLLPAGVSAYGADIARTQLCACINRFPFMANRLSWSQAEALPFPDNTFDATYSIGGFNYFQNPRRAADEMRRVTRRGGVVLIADERPDLKRFGLGHLIGLPAYDGWWMRRLGLPADFVEMILRTQMDLESILNACLPSARRVSIWRELGYLLVEPAPTWRDS